MIQPITEITVLYNDERDLHQLGKQIHGTAVNTVASEFKKYI